MELSNRKEKVDRTKEHFELRYGSANDQDWDQWMPVALISRPRVDLVNVEYLVDLNDPRYAETISKVQNEIQFYMFELNNSDPWAYAQYHCGTSSNLYSTVHWSFVKPNSSG